MTQKTTPPPHLLLNTKAQRRARIKPDLKSKLEKEYQSNSKPNKQEKQRIAQEYDMTADNVHFWFQNRRARESRELKKQKESSDQGSSNTASSSSTQVKPTSITPYAQQMNFTTLPSLVDARPRLPPIGTLFDGQGASNTASSTASSSSPFISTYFHHSPFGIDYTYSTLQYKQSRSSHQ